MWNVGTSDCRYPLQVVNSKSRSKSKLITYAMKINSLDFWNTIELQWDNYSRFYIVPSASTNYCNWVCLNLWAGPAARTSSLSKLIFTWPGCIYRQQLCGTLSPRLPQSLQLVTPQQWSCNRGEKILIRNYLRKILHRSKAPIYRGLSYVPGVSDRLTGIVNSHRTWHLSLDRVH